MYQSSARKNFLDTLSDPTAIAILGSIALHALIGSTFPFFTQPEKTGKKDAPTTVKVVELTPSEQQRIPQARPQPKPASIAKPIPTNRPVATAPRAPQFSTSPQAIPFSPVRTPATTKTSKPTTQKQPATPPVFDPNIFTEPTPKSSPTPKGTKPKPVAVKPAPAKPQSQPKKPKVAATPSPDIDTPMDWSGDGQEPGKPITTPQARTPRTAPTPSVTPTPSTTPQPVTPSPSNSTGDGPGYAGAANAKEIEYLNKYPGIKVYAPTDLKQPYPTAMACPKTKQLPIIVYMAVFDKWPENQNSDIMGVSTPDSLDASTFASEATPQNKELSLVAKNAAIYAANKQDQNRSPEDKGKRVLYRYRVQFDPSTCKK